MTDIISMKTVGPHLQQLQGLLKDAIMRVCENKAPFLKKLKIEGTVCITTDLEGAVVTQITETIVQSERRRELSPESPRRWTYGSHQMSPLPFVSHEHTTSRSPRTFPMNIIHRETAKRKMKPDPGAVDTKEEADSEDCVLIIPEEVREYGQDTKYSWHQPVPRRENSDTCKPKDTSDTPNGIDYSSPKKLTTSSEPPNKRSKVSLEPTNVVCCQVAPVITSWNTAAQTPIVIGQLSSPVERTRAALITNTVKVIETPQMASEDSSMVWASESINENPTRMQYTAQEMLSQARRGTKHSPAQTYFNDILRLAASRSGIWELGLRLKEVTAEQKMRFYNEIERHHEELKIYRPQVWSRLAQGLNNRRQYLHNLTRSKRQELPASVSEDDVTSDGTTNESTSDKIMDIT